MAMPTCYSTFLTRAYENNKKILPRCRSLKAEDILVALSSYFSNKYFDRYCAMATLFYSFPTYKRRRTFQASLCLLQTPKAIPGCQNMALKQDSHILGLCGNNSADF